VIVASWLTDVLAPVNHVVFTIGRDHVTWVELLGFITGVACVRLAAVQRISNWPIGIANSIFFGLLFIDARLWADASLQVVYVVLGALGWWAWLRLGPQRTALDVAHASRTLLMAVAIGVCAATAVLDPVLRAAHDSAPFLDATTTALSLGGQTLLCLKRLQNWYWWMAADLIYIPLYTTRHLYLTAVVYVVFLAICVRAVADWKSELATSPTPA
jgi:nicotinamide mononucleotide transporter